MGSVEISSTGPLAPHIRFLEPSAGGDVTVEARNTVEVGDTAPDFTLPSLDGDPVSLSDYRGKRVALFMWASW